MKKVLILAYDFPPYVSVGGLRPYSWYKYLHEFGVYPVVITRQWDNKFGNHLDYIAPSASSQNIIDESVNGTIIRTPYIPNFANRLMLKYGDSKYRFLRKAVSAYYEFAQFLFLGGPKSSLYFAAKEYLSKNKVDVIIATGDPFILFRYASKLSKIYNTPWIADYRDFWSQNIHIQKVFFLKKWNVYLEHKIVKTSAVITTVSVFLEIKISQLIKNKIFFILPNGYDPEAMENVKNINQLSDVLNVAFIGSIYDWNPLRSFFNVISQFIKSKKDVKIIINFYGINLYGITYNSELSEIISSEFPDLVNNVVVHKKVPNHLLLIELSKQNVMLLFNYYSYLGTKIFDYLGLQRVILFCYANDVESEKLKKKYYNVEDINGVSSHLQEDLIKETNSGYVIKDAEHLLHTLGKLYDEFTQKGFIECHTINAENYSRKHQVKQLAEIIKNISTNSK